MATVAAPRSTVSAAAPAPSGVEGPPNVTRFPRVALRSLRLQRRAKGDRRLRRPPPAEPERGRHHECPGNHQRLELQPWQPEIQRTVKVDYKWTPNAWYTMKLEVQSLGGGKVRARGKVWPKGQTEPAAWTIERVDPIGSLKGAPGLYADAPSQAGGGSELYYDNIKVYRNATK